KLCGIVAGLSSTLHGDHTRNAAGDGIGNVCHIVLYNVGGLYGRHGTRYRFLSLCAISHHGDLTERLNVGDHRNINSRLISNGNFLGSVANKREDEDGVPGRNADGVPSIRVTSRSSQRPFHEDVYPREWVACVIRHHALNGKISSVHIRTKSCGTEADHHKDYGEPIRWRSPEEVL